MSDSVDRVFVHALATVRRLPRTGSSRPPPSARLRLYGLYKQSMEGDVSAILPRPTLPVSSPDPNSGNNNNNNNSVHRYASRDVRTREAQAEIEKWDAWHACAGMSRTDAKREYISTLIDTMKEYASGTAESRELVNELEFVWSQIRSQSGSGSDPDHDDREGSPEKQSPEGRKSSSAGKSQPGSRPSIGSADPAGRRSSSSNNVDKPAQTRRQEQRQPQETSRKLTRTPSGLRVLSPVSQGNSDSINSPVDANADPDANSDNEHDQDNTHTHAQQPPSHLDPTSLQTLQQTLESHIHTLRTEIAALREQLSSNNLLSASTYTLGHHYYSLTRTQRFFHRLRHTLKIFSLLFLRQLFVQLGILGVVLLYGRVRGDLRVERWVRKTFERWREWAWRWGSVVVWWVIELFGSLGTWVRESRLGALGRWLRIT